jgi:hypothetical protein
MVVEREVQRLRAAQASREQEPEAWRDATGLSQAAVWLTAEEAHEIKDEITRLMMAKADRSARPDLRPADARLTSIVSWVVPSGPHRLPDEMHRHDRAGTPDEDAS